MYGAGMSDAQAGALGDGSNQPLPTLIVRCVIGGVLMGLANLVPGISGGTMLLAAGVYPNFIGAIADLSRLRFRVPALVTLAAVAVAAGLAIVAFAGPVKELVVHQRWVMYSVFIGLTLGGLPVVWRLARPATSATWAGAAGGFVLMAAVALLQSGGDGGGDGGAGSAWMFMAGVAGASAMILPGISGGYLLLVLGVYVPILGAIDGFKLALKAGDLGAALGPLGTLVPLGIGVVIGVLVVSNALRVALMRFEKATLGVLLGFLAGAVIGLWPFQKGVAPELGTFFKGQRVTEELLQKLDPSKFPSVSFDPSLLQILGALALVGLGFAATALLARVGQLRDA